eukprot:TRINITY_DN73329_c0_g1_i1.p1 TRINITY_DN73329_c0_g1~~TRINITY_DN73329_c0_g1_i1.p1  ORF type:complete len:325 (-),score=83.72 TRINITY_DN73329_c0_g1_i1:93-1001(-)
MPAAPLPCLRRTASLPGGADAADGADAVDGGRLAVAPLRQRSRCRVRASAPAAALLRVTPDEGSGESRLARTASSGSLALCGGPSGSGKPLLGSRCRASSLPRPLSDAPCGAAAAAAVAVAAAGRAGGSAAPASGCDAAATCEGAAGAGRSLVGLPAVLFLDVDGVLHPTTAKHPRQQFLSSCMSLLREVLDATGASIVLSTAWRLHPDARRELGAKLAEHGLPPFVSRTPSLAQFHRAKEILAWVKKHKPLTWVSVDDWPLLEETKEVQGHFVQTRPRYGLLPDSADQIIELFSLQSCNRG